jgi:RHS repeat-associated protein
MSSKAIVKVITTTAVDSPINAYYPFGKQITNLSLNPSGQKLRYNGKELQTQSLAGRALDWYDYGARFYDPTLGRWHSVDPLAEKYNSWSVYHYCANNPLNYTDPDGMQWWPAVAQYSMGQGQYNYSHSYNQWPSEAQPVIGGIGGIAVGVAQICGAFAGGAAAPGLAAIVIMDGAYKAMEGLHKIANATGGINEALDPKYSNAIGAITDNSKVDAVTDLLLSGMVKQTGNILIDGINSASTVVGYVKEIVKSGTSSDERNNQKSETVRPMDGNEAFHQWASEIVGHSYNRYLDGELY